MWQYNYSNDNDYLYHANGHKYIEKKRGTGGKWYYIYEDAKQKVKDAVGITAKEEYDKAVAKEKVYNKFEKDATRYAKSTGGVPSNYSHRDISSTFKSYYSSMGERHDLKGTQTRNKTRDAVIKSYKKYQSTPLYKITNFANKAKKKISGLLSKLFGK